MTELRALCEAVLKAKVDYKTAVGAYRNAESVYRACSPGPAKSLRADTEPPPPELDEGSLAALDRLRERLCDARAKALIAFSILRHAQIALDKAVLDYDLSQEEIETLMAALEVYEAGTGLVQPLPFLDENWSPPSPESPQSFVGAPGVAILEAYCTCPHPVGSHVRFSESFITGCTVLGCHCRWSPPPPSLRRDGE